MARNKSGVTAGGSTRINETLDSTSSQSRFTVKKQLVDVGLVDRLARTTGAVRIVKLKALDTEGRTRWKFGVFDEENG